MVVGIFVYKSFDAGRDIKLAERYIKEYRFAKALDLLNSSSKRSKKADLALEELLFYAAIKAQNFKTAEVILDEIKDFDAGFKKRFYEVVNILYKKDKDELFAKVLARSNRIKLDDDYLIALSKKQKNIEKEMQVLLMGRKLLLDIKEGLLQKKKIVDASEIKVDKIEKYILERYMNQASLFIAHQDYTSALEQLKKAENLEILKEDEVDEKKAAKKLEVKYKKAKADYKYLLGTVLKFLGQRDKSWDLIKQSAELGNMQAKENLEQARRRYRRN